LAVQSAASMVARLVFSRVDRSVVQLGVGLVAPWDAKWVGESAVPLVFARVDSWVADLVAVKAVRLAVSRAGV